MPKTPAKKQKTMLIIGTHADDDLEKAMLTFMASTAALAIGIKSTVFLISKGTNLAMKNYAETMPMMHGMESMSTLISNHLEMNGSLIVCIPCKESRGVKDNQFLSQVKFANMMDMAELVQASDKVLVF